MLYRKERIYTRAQSTAGRVTVALGFVYLDSLSLSCCELTALLVVARVCVHARKYGRSGPEHGPSERASGNNNHGEATRPEVAKVVDTALAPPHTIPAKRSKNRGGGGGGTMRSLG